MYKICTIVPYLNEFFELVTLVHEKKNNQYKWVIEQGENQLTLKIILKPFNRLCNIDLNNLIKLTNFLKL